MEVKQSLALLVLADEIANISVTEQTAGDTGGGEKYPSATVQAVH